MTVLIHFFWEGISQKFDENLQKGSQGHINMYIAANILLIEMNRPCVRNKNSHLDILNKRESHA